jgi:hypothetical protein
MGCRSLRGMEPLPPTLDRSRTTRNQPTVSRTHGIDMRSSTVKITSFTTHNTQNNFRPIGGATDIMLTWERLRSRTENVCRQSCG